MGPEHARTAASAADDSGPVSSSKWNLEPDGVSTGRPLWNALTLVFKDPELERLFGEYIRSRTATLARRSVVLAILLYAVFGFADYHLAGDAWNANTAIRFLIVVPYLLLVYFLLKLPRARRYQQPLMLSVEIVAGLGLLAMMAVMPREVGSLYFGGLALCCMFGYMVFPMGLVRASVAGWSLMAGFLLVARGQVFDGPNLVVYPFFFAAANIAGMFATWSLERYRRKNYFQLRSLWKQRAAFERLNEELERLATHDPLTGLLNRRSLDQRLAEVIAAQTRHGDTASLFLLDLDRFKQVNDQLGHLRGDAFLCQIAQLICVTVREIDVVFRFGGDEFLVLLPRTSEAQALVVADRLRTAFEQMVEGIEELRELGLGCSIGVDHVRDGDTPDAILRRADAMLYEEKQSKRVAAT